MTEAFLVALSLALLVAAPCGVALASLSSPWSRRWRGDPSALPVLTNLLTLTGWGVGAGAVQALLQGHVASFLAPVLFPWGAAIGGCVALAITRAALKVRSAANQPLRPTRTAPSLARS